MILRSYQEECINTLYEYFRTATGNPLCCLPTATGKSLIIAEFIRRVFEYWPHSRVLALVHVKELIKQNANTLLRIWPNAPIGINSAGLKRRDTIMPITFGGIASCFRHGELFGHIDLVFIDEAHLLSPEADTMYQKLIAQLRLINPHVKVIGLTATHFRMKQGLLTDGGLFTDICFNICDVDGFARLIHEGFLSPPIPQTTATKLDISNVGIQNGEFILSDLQKSVDKPDVTYSALTELCQRGQDRKSWLLFCSGIEHADHCADMLNSFGVPCASVHSKIKGKERDDRIAAFQSGELRAVTNNNVLTTGFDHPPIDLIGMLRPTMSPGLWVQMVGRGTRPFEGKTNCLVLDFAGNTKRLGPIDDPRIPGKHTKGAGEMPVKICDVCGTFNHTRVKFCVFCGTEFQFEQKLVRTSSPLELLSGGQPQIESYDIDRVMYNRHLGRKGKLSGQASIKISYLCGLNMFHEFVSFDFGGLPRHQANQWWRQRHQSPAPLSTDLALRAIMECRTPRKVKVWVNMKNPKVMGVEW